jgi:hypothetical protein
MRQPIAVPAAPNPARDTRLHGWPLALARAVFIAVTAVTTVAGIVGLPGLHAVLSRTCEDVISTCLIAPEQVAPLARLGLTPATVAFGVIGLILVAVALVDVVALVIFWNRSDDWMALLVALTLVLMPVWLTPGLQTETGPLQVIGDALSNAGFPLMMLLIALFPSGRFEPRWLWVPMLLLMLAPNFSGSLNLPNEVFLPLLLSLLLALIGGQIYRYRRVSTPAQRSQTKWVVYGIALTILINQAFWQPLALLPAVNQPDALFSLLFMPVNFLMIVALAGSFGIAILRYRLYDIDVIIRRTLIYGALSVILAALYFALVLGGQAIVRAVLGRGEQQPVLVVASTLLVAALFTPLRRFLQAAIDRRFYRHKYDAARTLAAFGATLRTETDLSAMRERLLEVVNETMQPALVALWLPASHQAPELAGGDAPGQHPSGTVTERAGARLLHNSASFVDTAPGRG